MVTPPRAHGQGNGLAVRLLAWHWSDEQVVADTEPRRLSAAANATTIAARAAMSANEPRRTNLR
jgi:hypothetical protein